MTSIRCGHTTTAAVYSYSNDSHPCNACMPLVSQLTTSPWDARVLDAMGYHEDELRTYYALYNESETEGFVPRKTRLAAAAHAVPIRRGDAMCQGVRETILREVAMEVDRTSVGSSLENGVVYYGSYASEENFRRAQRSWRALQALATGESFGSMYAIRLFITSVQVPLNTRVWGSRADWQTVDGKLTRLGDAPYLGLPYPEVAAEVFLQSWADDPPEDDPVAGAVPLAVRRCLEPPR